MLDRVALLLALCLASGCRSTGSQVRAAKSETCATVLRGHASLAGDAEYSKQLPEVILAYEQRVASCEIEVGDPARAIALASSWSVSQAVEQAEVTARASARSGDDERARDALERLSLMRGARAAVFAGAPELRRFAGRDWFVRAALRAWSRDRRDKLDVFFAHVAGVRVSELLSLSVASADPGRAPGAWGIWSGVVRESRLDRERRVTTLFAEGIDTYELRIDERVRLSAGKGDKRASTPDIDIRGRAGEQLAPNGRKFVVEVNEIQASLAELRTFIAVGKLAGRTDSEDRPVLEGFLVVDRQPRGGTEME